mgnify:CR=1 FL=1
MTLQPAMVLYTTYMISTTTAIYYCNAHGCTNAYLKFNAHLSALEINSNGIWDSYTSIHYDDTTQNMSVLVFHAC